MNNSARVFKDGLSKAANVLVLTMGDVKVYLHVSARKRFQELLASPHSLSEIAAYSPPALWKANGRSKAPSVHMEMPLQNYYLGGDQSVLTAALLCAPWLTAWENGRVSASLKAMRGEVHPDWERKRFRWVQDPRCTGQVSFSDPWNIGAQYVGPEMVNAMSAAGFLTQVPEHVTLPVVQGKGTQGNKSLVWKGTQTPLSLANAVRSASFVRLLPLLFAVEPKLADLKDLQGLEAKSAKPWRRSTGTYPRTDAMRLKENQAVLVTSQGVVVSGSLEDVAKVTSVALSDAPAKGSDDDKLLKGYRTNVPTSPVMRLRDSHFLPGVASLELKAGVTAMKALMEESGSVQSAEEVDVQEMLVDGEIVGFVLYSTPGGISTVLNHLRHVTVVFQVNEDVSLTAHLSEEAVVVEDRKTGLCYGIGVNTLNEALRFFVPLLQIVAPPSWMRVYETPMPVKDKEPAIAVAAEALVEEEPATAG